MLLADFMPYVLPDAQHCPEPMAEQALRLALIEFARRTALWVEIQTPLIGDGVKTVFDFALPFAEAAQLPRRPYRESACEKLLHVWIDEVAQYVPEADSRLRLADMTRSEQIAYRVSPSSFACYTAPKAGEEIVTHCVLVPTMQCDQVPDAVFSEYVEPIARGALGRLLRVQGQPWTNNELSVTAQSEFNSRIQVVAFQAERGFGTRLPRARTTSY